MAKDKSRPRGGGGHRITNAEAQKRVEQMEVCLANGWRDGEIKRVFTKAWDCSGRQVLRYVSRARDNLTAALGESRTTHRARSLAHYQSVLSDPKATRKEKMHAQLRIDKLLGLEAPTMIAPVTPGGKSLFRVAAGKMTKEQLEAVAAMRGMADEQVEADEPA